MCKRIFIFALAVLMLLSMVACNNEKTPDVTEDVTPEQPTNGGEDGPDDTQVAWGAHLPTDTYNNEEFSIMFRDGSRYTDGTYAEDSPDNTSVVRAVYERMLNIEDKYKIKFYADETSVSSSDMTARVSGYAKTGTDPFELIAGDSGNTLWSLAINGCLYEWGDLELIQLDEPYWNQNARTQFTTPGGKLYFMTGDISYWSVGAAFCLFFNKDHLGNVIDLESPYDKVRNNEWDLETFSEYVITVDSNMDGDKSGTLETDNWGYVTAGTRGGVQIMVTTKYPLLERNESYEGGYRCNLTREDLSGAVSAFSDLFKSGSAYLDTEKKWVPLKGSFTSGRSAFYDDMVYMATQMTAAGLNFGILPWPKYTEETPVYNSLVDSGVDGFALPINSTDANVQMISVVLENLAYRGTEIVEFYSEVILTYQDFKDEESIEMMSYIYEGLNYDFGYYYGEAGLRSVAVSSVVEGISLSRAYESVEGKVIEALKKWTALDN